MSKQFEYKDSKQVVHKIEIEENDFALVQEHVDIHDQKMQSKPTTFFKDAMRRFAKNKSSVVAACMLGTLILLSIILPIAISSDVSDGVYANNYQKNLYPKLFAAGTGWWDGCKNVDNVPISVDYEAYEERGELIATPSASSSYKLSAVVGGSSGITLDHIEYSTTGTSASGFGGYVRLYGVSNPTLVSPLLPDGVDFTQDQGIVITVETADSTIAGDTAWNYGNEDCPYSISILYTYRNDDFREVTDTFDLASNLVERGTVTINLDEYREAFLEQLGSYTLRQARIAISVDTSSLDGQTNANLLVDSAELNAPDEELNAALENISFIDANNMFIQYQNDSSYAAYWTPYRTASYSAAYRVMLFYGSFRYDTYEDALGNYTSNDVGYSNLELWVNRGWLKISSGDNENALPLIATSNLAGMSRSEVQAIADSLEFEILTERCPFVSEESIKVSATQASSTSAIVVSVGGEVTRWKELFPNRNSCPSYLFGTDFAGKDLLKYVAEGLRTSLLLGVLTFIVCFTFGLIYGAIAGYYGGWTDILMERVTDILGGVPWIVVMTLAIVKWGSNLTVFVLALCFTGWIGTSSLTRTQFYRYKNREYILAARTLGASDPRLIFRHILPNAVGTIVTSSVLMIPSIIYSEATLAYLNLGLQGVSSFGVILSDNQQYIKTDSYMILFPSVVMALLMISFNLFGNGLRDAFNPSLKGAEN